MRSQQWIKYIWRSQWIRQNEMNVWFVCLASYLVVSVRLLKITLAFESRRE